MFSGSLIPITVYVLYFFYMELLESVAKLASYFLTDVCMFVVRMAFNSLPHDLTLRVKFLSTPTLCWHEERGGDSSYESNSS